MKADLPIPVVNIPFSREEIEKQVQKIFLDPFFANSDILRKFLSFIVDQTLKGHADWLKEYTIGVNVLKKSADFKPQDNGIVRIHAGRLRRALHNYYKTMGVPDPIRITIPKGRYVPLFADNSADGAAGELPGINGADVAAVVKPEVIAVLPFQHFNDNAIENSLIDGLGLQLSTALMQFSKYSVVAHYTVRDLWKRTADLQELAASTEIKYVVCGCIQTMDNKVRSHVQMIDLHNGIQVWSCMYEADYVAENIFCLQDEMVRFIIAELIKSRKFIDEKIRLNALVAVA